MQISFDPFNAVERALVVDVIDMLADSRSDGSATVAIDVTPAASEGPDTRDAASVFGPAVTIGAGGASGGPLGMPAPFTAVAGQSPTAPAGAPGFAPPQNLGASPGAQPGQQQAASAPSASAGPTSPAGDVDSAGMRWDARIHAANKAVKQNGTWRAKKGLNDEAFVKQVEAELRQGMPALAAPAPAPVQAPAPVAAPTMPPPPPMTFAQGTLPLAGAAAPSAMAPAAPVAQALQLVSPAPAPVASPTADPADFDEMMPRITAAIAAGTFPETGLLDAAKAHGLSSLVPLTANPQYVTQIWAYLKQSYPSL